MINIATVRNIGSPVSYSDIPTSMPATANDFRLIAIMVLCDSQSAHDVTTDENYSRFHQELKSKENPRVEFYHVHKTYSIGD